MGIKEYVKQTRERDEFEFAFPVAEIAKRAGEVLRQLRESSNKNQMEIANELNLSQPRMSQIESGRAENLPSLALMSKYAKVCGDEICLLPKSEYYELLSKIEESERTIKKLARDIKKQQDVRYGSILQEDMAAVSFSRAIKYGYGTKIVGIYQQGLKNLPTSKVQFWKRKRRLKIEDIE